jgi:hypothetical protein
MVVHRKRSGIADGDTRQWKWRASDCYRPGGGPETRLQRFARTMRQEDNSFAALAEALSKSADSWVLRRLIARQPFTPSVGKDALKRRGYRWSDRSDGRPRSWYIDVDEVSLDAGIGFLRAKIYLRDLEPRFQTLTAFDHFSVRS